MLTDFLQSTLSPNLSFFSNYSQIYPQILLKSQINFLNIQQESGGDLTYTEMLARHKRWSYWRTAHKILHPGNSLMLAFILTAVGVGLVGFGVACPPILVFFALGLALVSAITAVVYATKWLRRDYAAYKVETAAQEGGLETSFWDYIKTYPAKLKQWASLHPVQTGFMVVGLILFTAALILVLLGVTGGLAGVPLLAGAIGGAGLSGGALGLTSGFFSAGLAIIPGITAGAASTLASTFAGATLVLFLTHIIDQGRRFCSGIYHRPKIIYDPRDTFIGKTEADSEDEDVLLDTSSTEGRKNRFELIDSTTGERRKLRSQSPLTPLEKITEDEPAEIKSTRSSSIPPNHKHA